ncbi:hypothetical protein F5I97DRAFT_36652 [Phlebopus sp. FC_14]|nr:hypothetical protein F5I97DRAFT_36652 [Phlebopus sp. FC_14]
MFFWSVQDFVMGLRGVLLGHEYLVQIGILHGDISENSILLALIPGSIRGYLTDFDMAIPYQTTFPKQQPFNPMEFALSRPSKPSDSLAPSGPFKAERTGTTPYMVINVLDGVDHTHHDDIESFFYVLVLFFMTYTRPLSQVDLTIAESQGYAQNVTSAQQSHIKEWPSLFQAWNGQFASEMKESFFTKDKHAQEFMRAVHERWKDRDVFVSIAALFGSSRSLFHGKSNRRVDHWEFVAVLDEWLEHYPVPSPGYNSCPSPASTSTHLRVPSRYFYHRALGRNNLCKAPYQIAHVTSIGSHVCGRFGISVKQFCTHVHSPVAQPVSSRTAGDWRERRS